MSNMDANRCDWLSQVMALGHVGQQDDPGVVMSQFLSDAYFTYSIDFDWSHITPAQCVYVEKDDGSLYNALYTAPHVTEEELVELARKLGQNLATVQNPPTEEVNGAQVQRTQREMLLGIDLQSRQYANMSQHFIRPEESIKKLKAICWKSPTHYVVTVEINEKWVLFNDQQISTLRYDFYNLVELHRLLTQNGFYPRGCLYIPFRPLDHSNAGVRTWEHYGNTYVKTSRTVETETAALKQKLQDAEMMNKTQPMSQEDQLTEPVALSNNDATQCVAQESMCDDDARGSNSRSPSPPMSASSHDSLVWEYDEADRGDEEEEEEEEERCRELTCQDGDDT